MDPSIRRPHRGTSSFRTTSAEGLDLGLGRRMRALTTDLRALNLAVQDGAAPADLRPPGAPMSRGFPYLLDALTNHFQEALYWHRADEEAAAAERAALAARRAETAARLLFVGAAAPTERFNILGWRDDDRPFAVSREGGQVTGVVGTLGVGKSQTLLTMLDSLFAPTDGLTSVTLPPTAALALVCAPGEVPVPDLLYALLPNPEDRDAQILRQRLGAEPGGIGQVRLVCPASEIDATYGRLRAELGEALARRVELAPLVLPPSALGQLGLEALLGADPDGPPSYLLDVLAKAQELGDDLSARGLQALVDEEGGLTRQQKALARGRIGALAGVLDPRADLGGLLVPGALTVAGLFGRWLRRSAALPLGMVVLHAALQPSPHGPLQRFFALDELDAMPDDPLLWGALARLIRQARHLGGNVWLSGQDLLRLPPELMGLLTHFLCFCLRSPRIFGQLRERVAGLLGIRFSTVSALEPGEALWVPTLSSDPAWCGRAARVRIRPPRCAHGGHTRAVR